MPDSECSIIRVACTEIVALAKRIVLSHLFYGFFCAMGTDRTRLYQLYLVHRVSIPNAPETSFHPSLLDPLEVQRFLLHVWVFFTACE